MKIQISLAISLLLLLLPIGCATLEAAQKDFAALQKNLGIVPNARTIAGLKIEATSCDVNEFRSATCTLFVTSIGQDRKVSVLPGGYTKVQDNTGKSYPTRVSWGKDPEAGQLGTTLIADIPYEVTLTADNLSSQANRVRAVEIERWDSTLNGVYSHVKVVLSQPPVKAVDRSSQTGSQSTSMAGAAPSQVARIPVPQPGVGTPTTTSVKMFRGLRVEVTSCEINLSRSATCRLLVTASSDRKLGLLRGGYTMVQDDTGKSYPTRISFGRDAESQQVESALIANTPYDVTLIADGLAREAAKVRAIDIARWDMTINGSYSKVQLLLPRPPMIAVANGLPRTRTPQAPVVVPKSAGASTPVTDRKQSSVPEGAGNFWEVVGYWDYDGVDGLQLGHGLVLRAIAGGGFGATWKYQLDLVKHDQLPPRNRFLSPVRINRKLKLICVNVPGYPSYTGNVDVPGSQHDGTYQFGSCQGGS